LEEEMFRRDVTVWVSVVVTLMMLYGCGILSSDSDSGREPLGGDPSPMGAVGHEFGVVTPAGVSGENVVVVANEDGASTIRYTGTVENPVMLELLGAMPDVEVNGNQISCERTYRITTEGFQNVYEDGYLTFMKYDADEGDTYSMERNGRELKRVVTKVSKEDEYQWGFFLIKTVHVEETGRGLPGVSKVEYIGNHRFGMVGVKLHYEDGSSQTLTIIAQAENN
jgi:hypothetical protein